MKQWKGPSRFEVVLNLLFIFQSILGVIYGVLFGPFLGIKVLWYVGWLVLVVGFLFFYLAIRKFKEKGKAPEGESLQFTTVLVDTGVYAIIRHPQCLGCILLMGASILISQYWLSAIIGVPISVYYYLSVPKDEKILVEKFGDDYKRYMQKVPRMNFVVGITRLLRRRKI
jgi:protein-S-isoprenylcysteine O-methyltransferase Ste14